MGRGILRPLGASSRVFGAQRPVFYLAIQRSVAFGVILSLLFVFLFLFVCTVEDISTQDGAIGVKVWLRVERTSWTGTR